MRLSLATVFATVAAGVVAEEVRTVYVTETTTYCPKSTAALSVPESESISIPPGYTTTRPLITSTVTDCSKCSTTTTTPAATAPADTPTGVNPVESSFPSAPVDSSFPSAPADTPTG
ncbi:hypothetical protein BDV28DRAFT_152653, partial [Aspergillus coremiiformis]